MTNRRTSLVLAAATLVATAAGAAAPAASAVPAPTRSVATVSAAASVTTVKASLFRRSTGYYFVSPSGHLHCGMVAGMVGCQSDRVVKNMPRCKRPTVDSAPIATLYGKQARTWCTREGIFNVQRARVLKYNQRVTLGTATCTSTTAGVTCTNRAGHSIFASAQKFTAR